ncbi:MAG: hypothetical protein K2I29_05830 [Clostridia bacterium]|nr:hypothetical protein [Clostridia bacterium]
MTNEPVEFEKIETTDEVKAAKPQKVKKPKNPVIQKDIMRYKKNKFGANLAILGLALGCLYFLVLYAQVKNNDFYYTWQIAFDVIYNLFFLLFVFLFSEQVKNYKRKLFPLQIVVGVLQIARIFWLPFTGMLASAITWATFLAMAIFLAASGACIIASAIIGFIRSKEVDEFSKKLEAGEVDLEVELKKEENGGEVNA